MEAPKDNTILVLSDRATIRARQIYELLDQNEMESPTITKDPVETLISSEYKFKFLLINIDYENFANIIEAAQKCVPKIGIIVIWDIKKLTEEQAKEITTKLSLTNLIERGQLNLKNFGNLITTIKESQAIANEASEQKQERYSFIKKIGIGANAEVFLYRDNEKEILVAVKKISLEGMDGLGKSKVKQEVDYMKSVKSPTIISLYDSTVENNVRYLYLEYAKEGTLEQKIRDVKLKGGLFEITQILEWIIEILLSLYVLNKKNMMHRDIKSENILVTESNVAKLADLGISKIIVEEGEHTLCGTPYYVSPEIASGIGYKFNTDIWSLGIVLYEMITGIKPFDQMEAKDLYNSIKVDEYPPLPETTHPVLGYLVEMMLRKNPKRRYSVDEIIQLDLIYDRLMALISLHKWAEEIPFYKDLMELKKVACFQTIPIVTDDNFKMLQNAYKVYKFSESTPYKKSAFSLSSISYAKTGENLLIATVEEIIEDEEEAHKFLNKLIQYEILIPFNSKIKEIESNEFYYFSFDNSNNLDYDNYPIIINNILEPHVDLMTLSESLLYEGMIVIDKFVANEEKMDVLTSLPYIKFMSGLSYMKLFSLMTLTEDQRLATMLNIYQVMFINYICNIYLENVVTKGGILSLFKSSKKSVINYQFKDITLNNLEIKHVVMRNNKNPPNSYSRLVYNSDVKTKILPGFTDLRPLFILYDFDDENLLNLKYRFQIFESKEISDQLDEIVIQFLNVYVSETEGSITLPIFLKNYITDFGSLQDMFKLLSKIYVANKEKPLIMQIKIAEENFEFMGNTTMLMRKLKNESYSITYE